MLWLPAVLKLSLSGVRHADRTKEKRTIVLFYYKNPWPLIRAADPKYCCTDDMGTKLADRLVG